jgi:putative ABC transport system substrate-binding protein
MPVIGFVSGVSAAPFAHLVAAFREGLKESGYIEGQNVAIEYRWAEGRYDHVPALVADLVHRQVTVIVASGGDQVVQAAKAATSTIPIVGTIGLDPVKQGLVASLNRPGGNLTGMFLLTTALGPKRLGLLRELVPGAALIAVLVNPTYVMTDAQVKDIQDAASAIGQPIHIVNASTDTEIDIAFAELSQLHPGALLVGADPFFNSRRNHIVALAARMVIPVMYEQREFAVAGGLASYGTSLTETYRQVGIYTGRVLKGEKPADLPVMLSTKFEFVINLKTAKALGFDVPAGLSARADEVIE